jgi:hypothetical protein
VFFTAVGLVASLAHIASSRADYSRQVLTIDLEAAGYYCGNHSPSHYAASAQQLEEYTQKYGCTGWTYVDTREIAGAVVGSSDEPIGGANLVVLSGDSLALSAATTTAEGHFRLIGVPLRGRYELQARVIGYSTYRRVIDVSEVDELFIRLSRSPTER